MHPQQYERMMRRNAAKRAAKRADLTPTPEPTPAEPTPNPDSFDSFYASMLALDADLPVFSVELLWKEFHKLNGSHWLWRAQKLLEYVERKGYRHDTPVSKNGKRVPMRKLIGLPLDPRRVAFQDDVIAAVEIKVKSLPNKGVVPILKTVGRRELEDVHTKAKNFVRDPLDGRERMHVTMRDPISEPELIRWLGKLIRLLTPGPHGKSIIQANILHYERLYGIPYMVQAFRYGPMLHAQLESHGHEKSSSTPLRAKGRRPMTTVQRRSRRYHYMARDLEDRAKNKSRKPTYMSAKQLALSTYYDVRG